MVLKFDIHIHHIVLAAGSKVGEGRLHSIVCLKNCTYRIIGSGKRSSVALIRVGYNEPMKYN